MKPQASNSSDKPALDEGAFQELLSAAYVLQQHKDRLQLGNEQDSAYAKTLTQLLEIQEEVRNRNLDLQAVASLVARRVREITNASGAAIGMLEDDQLEYYAASGTAAAEAGSRVPFDSSLAAECLRSGKVLQFPDAQADTRLPFQLCRRLSVCALIAAPISHEGKILGALELHFSDPNSFQEQQVRVCQLLAALIGEASARNVTDESGTISGSAPGGINSESVSSSLASDRASLLAALNRIKPQLERLVGESAEHATPPPAPSPLSPIAQTKLPASVCLGCGNDIDADSLFCGVCGTARTEEQIVGREETLAPAPKNTWSSLWDLQRNAEKSRGTTSVDDAGGPNLDSDSLDVSPSELEDLVAQVAKEPAQAPGASAPMRSVAAHASSHSTPNPFPAPARPFPAALTADLADETLDSAYGPRPELPSLDPETASQSIPVSSASGLSPQLRARTRPEPASPKIVAAPEPPADSADWIARIWQSQRANIYVAAAALFLLAVLAGWLTPSPPPAASRPGATPSVAHRHKEPPPKPELSFFDQLLVDLGLAEAPPPPAEMGNPDTRVWIDVHTALYYCPGSELFGKTPEGRFTTQGEAQQDAFRSATRKACD